MHDDDTQWGAWAQALAALAAQAREQDRVLSRALEDGVELLAYPLAGDGVLVGLGLGPARAERLDTGALLRRRGLRMDRAGHWLPARFEDGSVFVLRRWPQASGPAWPGGVAEALRHAWELFDE